MYNLMWDSRLTKTSVDGMEATIQGLYSTDRSERKWETRRQRGLRFEDTHGAAEIRAALVAKQRGRGDGRGHVEADDIQSTVPYGRVL